MNDYHGRHASQLLALPLVAPDQEKNLLTDKLDDVRVNLMVEITCERCSKLVGAVYDMVNKKVQRREELYAPCGAVAVVSTKRPPHAGILFIERSDAPAFVTCACRRDGADVLALGALHRALLRERGVMDRRRTTSYLRHNREVVRINRHGSVRAPSYNV